MKIRQRNLAGGFTMIEMLVVVTIAAMLAAAGMVSYTTINRNARNAKREADLTQVRSAIEFYRTDVGSYPSATTFTSLVDALKSGGYLTGNYVDPKNVSPLVYVYDNVSPFPVATDCPAAKTYALCAARENTGGTTTQFCICNP